MASSGIMENLDWTSGRISSLRGWSGKGTGYSRKEWITIPASVQKACQWGILGAWLSGECGSAGLADRLSLKNPFQLKLCCDSIFLFRQMSHTCARVTASMEQQSWHPALCDPRGLCPSTLSSGLDEVTPKTSINTT